MKLERFSLVDTEDWIFDGENEYPVTTQAIGPVDDGEYYRAADVDALLASIRAAVEAEREAELRHGFAILDDSPVTTGGGPTYHTSRAVTSARAALDALLAEGGV